MHLGVDKTSFFSRFLRSSVLTTTYIALPARGTAAGSHPTGVEVYVEAHSDYCDDQSADKTWSYLSLDNSLHAYRVEYLGYGGGQGRIIVQT